MKVSPDGTVWYDGPEALAAINCTYQTLRDAREHDRIRYYNQAMVTGRGARFFYEKSSVEAFAKRFNERKLKLWERRATLEMAWTEPLDVDYVEDTSELSGDDVVLAGKIRAIHRERRRRMREVDEMMARKQHEDAKPKKAPDCYGPDYYPTEEIFRLVDAERVAQGLPPIYWVKPAPAALAPAAPNPTPPAPTTPAACGHILAPLCGCR